MLNHSYTSSHFAFISGLCGLFLAAASAQTLPSFTATTLAGNGTILGAWTGDAGPATQAELNVPTNAIIDPKGNLYIATISANHRVRYVQPTGTGIITTAAGDGVAGFWATAAPPASQGRPVMRWN